MFASAQALEPFCVEHSKFFDSPFGGRRAEGRSDSMTCHDTCSFSSPSGRPPCMHNDYNCNSHSSIPRDRGGGLRERRQARARLEVTATTTLTVPASRKGHCATCFMHLGGDRLHDYPAPSRRVQTWPWNNCLAYSHLKFAQGLSAAAGKLCNMLLIMSPGHSIS